MTQWLRASALDEVWEGAALPVTVGEHHIALYRFGDEVRAVGDFCPHQKDVRLSDGYLEGDTIECPMHQSCFNVRTGQVLSPPARENLPVFEVRIEDGQVFVAV